MRLGVFLALFGNKDLDTTLDYLQKVGIDTVEVGTGNYPPDTHCKPKELLGNKQAQQDFLDKFKRRGISISALSCHGNPIHPDEIIAKAHADVQRDTIQLAAELGIGQINTFSGCPGGGPGDKTPNWVTCPWPDDFLNILDWQWNEVIIPFWQKESAFAREHNVKVALEMHPGFVVYNPETMLRLRKTAGDNIGANFDPSHLWWQGMDPIAAVRELGDAIYHVHAKDVNVDPINTSRNGVLDTKHYGQELQRSWIFRTVGYGHDELFWRNFISNLRMVGYDYVISIEHEDSLMSVNEGLTKAVNLLKGVLLTEDTGGIWWA
jgi:sugar phosphate isomerase/epimerase